MSSILLRAALAAGLLAVAAAITPASAASSGLSGCQPTCVGADTANRFNSNDPTDPAKAFMTIISPVVRENLDKATKEDAAMKYDAALADTKTAQAAAQSDYEKLKVDQMLTQVYMDQKDYGNADDAAEAAADLPKLPAAEKPDLFTNACILATAMQHYDKAVKYAHGMQDLKLTDARSKRIIDAALQHETKP